MFKLIVRSRNYSCKPLRELEVIKPTILRLGSVTSTEEITKHKKYKGTYVELNKVDACAKSGNKQIMKRCFIRGKISTAPYFEVKAGDTQLQKLKYYLGKWSTIIAKRYNSSKGNGIYLIKDEESFNNFRKEVRDWYNYVFERYYTYTKEYRLHVTKDGCFHASRKMLKNDAEVRWHRHENNSVWIKEENELFDKPTNWNDIVDACIRALKSLGLDIASFDIKVQNNKHKYPKFIILESNSAPAMGDSTLEKYKEIINKIINNG